MCLTYFAHSQQSILLYASFANFLTKLLMWIKYFSNYLIIVVFSHIISFFLQRTTMHQLVAWKSQLSANFRSLVVSWARSGLFATSVYTCLISWSRFCWLLKWILCKVLIFYSNKQFILKYLFSVDTMTFLLSDIKPFNVSLSRTTLNISLRHLNWVASMYSHTKSVIVSLFIFYICLMTGCEIWY